MSKQKKEEKEKVDKTLYDDIIKNDLWNSIIGNTDGRIATALVYEKIGDMEVFEGTFPLLRGSFDIGEYTVLKYKKGKLFYLDTPASEDYIPCKDNKIGKILHIVKYSEEDFRIKKRLDETYYKIKHEPVMEEKKLIDENDEPVLDEFGEVQKIKYHKKNEEGELLYNEVEEKYKYPYGITQDGQDIIRTHNNIKQEIKEFKEKNKGVWDKYGGAIINIGGLAVVAMLFLMSMHFTTDNWQKTIAETTSDIKDLNENVQWWNNPDALNNIADKTQKITDEKNAPPK